MSAVLQSGQFAKQNILVDATRTANGFANFCHVLPKAGNSYFFQKLTTFIEGGSSKLMCLGV